ncbi:hypothetical protein [Asticcacaulis sp. 201]|uniref:hypothetical protein n=1 Tax=Asticcacaulis sp. 201 TaxID=3028787 RepID=UPI002916013A|nr:hypothetical protein [Asticcacaulis sp. 201]MDV6333234.1 hypothetical protein [Asticcacaulis sp. 201]
MKSWLYSADIVHLRFIDRLIEAQQSVRTILVALEEYNERRETLFKENPDEVLQVIDKRRWPSRDRSKLVIAFAKLDGLLKFIKPLVLPTFNSTAMLCDAVSEFATREFFIPTSDYEIQRREGMREKLALLTYIRVEHPGNPK